MYAHVAGTSQSAYFTPKPQGRLSKGTRAVGTNLRVSVGEAGKEASAICSGTVLEPEKM
jgi:hypothetical protein